jgi:hypothetical protein
VWVPEDTEDIERAIAAGTLTETSSFDGKRQVASDRKKLGTIAVDIAAMSTEGGSILYGVGEDADKRLTERHPVALAGVADRINDVVNTSITEVPFVEIRTYELPDDSTSGYLVAVVPASPRAPHMVVVKDEHRYYGRGATGNRLLSEGEVARLYERRERWTADREQLLARTIANAPFAPQPRLGYVHAFAEPVARSGSLLERAISNTVGNRDAVLRAMQDAMATTGPRSGGGYSPALHGHLQRVRLGADAWRFLTTAEPITEPEDARYISQVEFNVDGRATLFVGRAAERLSRSGPDESGRLMIFEAIIAGNLASFYAAMGALYHAAGYHGHVDVGFCVTGIAGGMSAMRAGGAWFDVPEYAADTYPRTDQVAAAQLIEPEAVLRPLLAPLFEATTGRDDFDPFG